VADEFETMAPLQMQRLASSAPWSLVSLILLYGGMAGHTVNSKIIGFGGAAVLALVSFRAARLRLLLGPDVVIVGWLKSTHYPWSEIDKFVLNDKGPRAWRFAPVADWRSRSRHSRWAPPCSRNSGKA
jgi:hypothetical protein